MSIIAKVSVPDDAFELGRLSTGSTGVELDRICTRGHSTIHYLWVHSRDSPTFESSASDQDFEQLRVLDNVSDRRLYRVERESGEHDLTGALRKFDGELLHGRHRPGSWEFRVGFADLNQLSKFQNYCIETSNLSMELQTVFKAIQSAPLGSDLTPRQQEALVTAHEAGYYDIPRRASQLEVADQLGLSDQAVSERLRRGESKLIQKYLLDDEDPDQDSGRRF